MNSTFSRKMDISCKVEASNTPLESEQPSTRLPYWTVITDDQRFLLLFIFSNYFGPDLKDGWPHKSVLQRTVEGRPPYTAQELAGSQMDTLKMERIYHYVLRKADKSVIVERETLHQFLQGCLYSPSPIVDLRQFPDLFPPHLHRLIRSENQPDVIENIVFISYPGICFIKEEDCTKFKKLSRRKYLFMDMDAVASYCRIGGFAYNANQDLPGSSSRRSHKRQADHQVEIGNLGSVPPLCSLAPYRNCSASNNREVNSSFAPSAADGNDVTGFGHGMIFYPTIPTAEEWRKLMAAASEGIGLKGSVAKIQAGPMIGLFDIGTCEDAYLFRISLPGVKQNGSKLFMHLFFPLVQYVEFIFFS